jgi:hypothetical protein
MIKPRWGFSSLLEQMSRTKSFLNMVTIPMDNKQIPNTPSITVSVPYVEREPIDMWTNAVHISDEDIEFIPFVPTPPTTTVQAFVDRLRNILVRQSMIHQDRASSPIAALPPSVVEALRADSDFEITSEPDQEVALTDEARCRLVQAEIAKEAANLNPKIQIFQPPIFC